MKQLVDASHALSNALDQSQLRIEAWRHVPGLAGGRPAWIAVTALHTSQWIMEPDGERVWTESVTAQARKEALVASALSKREQTQLNSLLRKLMLEFES